MGRLAYLDGWRGLAILAVLLGHFGPKPTEQFGHLGVELFFVLSGRLMAMLLIERDGTYSRFFARRASRILPAMACYVIVALGLNIALGWGGFSAAQWISLLTFTVNYHYATGDSALLLLHLWSVCVEEYSYLALALIGFVAAHDGKKAGVLAMIIAVAAMANGLSLYFGGKWDLQEIYLRTDTRIASIALSFGIACLWKPRFFWPYFLTGAAVLLGPAPLKFTLGTTCLALAVNSIDGAKYRQLFELPLLCFVGLISYSLYLWQHPFYRLDTGMLGLAAAFLIAWLSYRHVEGPGRAVLNRAWDRFEASRSAGSASRTVS